MCLISSTCSQCTICSTGFTYSFHALFHHCSLCIIFFLKGSAYLLSSKELLLTLKINRNVAVVHFVPHVLNVPYVPVVTQALPVPYFIIIPCVLVVPCVLIVPVNSTLDNVPDILIVIERHFACV